MRRYVFVWCLAVAAAIVATGSAHADQAPIRHLVYNFQITFTTQTTVHSSGFSGADDPDRRASGDSTAGVADVRMGSDDKGTITADVLSVQPDSGLVVRVSERAHEQRSSAPTLCVVYGTGSTICDQTHGELNQEEMALLRLLGRGFINPAEIDAHKHWEYSSSAAQANEKSDYTITKTDGNVLDVAYQRQLNVAGTRPFNSATDGTLAYNQMLNVPLSVNEDTITHRTSLSGNFDKIENRLTLTLATDSLQTAQNH